MAEAFHIQLSTLPKHQHWLVRIEVQQLHVLHTGFLPRRVLACTASAIPAISKGLAEGLAAWGGTLKDTLLLWQGHNAPWLFDLRLQALLPQ
jgi:hypothetical protein